MGRRPCTPVECGKPARSGAHARRVRRAGVAVHRARRGAGVREDDGDRGLVHRLLTFPERDCQLRGCADLRGARCGRCSGCHDESRRRRRGHQRVDANPTNNAAQPTDLTSATPRHDTDAGEPKAVASIRMQPHRCEPTRPARSDRDCNQTRTSGLLRLGCFARVPHSVPGHALLPRGQPWTGAARRDQGA